ncbi:MAG: carboxypeptidase regulatory-like domain-containing protein, partial [Planctomycetes bacterium]|nr:carboxypeptidase regulatory-like domain-containing protein [Planctomycetota bacterium]
MGKGVGSSIGQATLGLTNESNAVSGIKLTTGNFSLSGKATDKKNKPIQGVLMTLSGDINTSASTDEKGDYVFSSLDSGDYTITPTLEGYTFIPKSRDVTITTRNKKNIKFKGRKLLKSSHVKNDALRLLSPTLITPNAEAVGWPYGEPDADGYYTVNGYKMRLYDDSDNVITDMPTSYASVVKIEIKVEESYADGSVNGSIFANTSFSAGGLSYPLVFNGTLDLTMDSDEFG